MTQVSSGELALAVQESGPPDRPPIVLIHGYPDTHTLWDLVVERLQDRHRLVTYDVRGAGASGAPGSVAGYELERLADDFQAVCEAVSPDRPVHLVGHDWGSIQGWEFATAPRFAGRIASFTAVAGPALTHAAGAAAGAGFSPVRALRDLPRLRRSWYIVPLSVPGLEEIIWGTLIDRSRWERHLIAEGARTDARYPAATLIADGRRGANLYRRNIALAAVRPEGTLGLAAGPRRAHVPVQIVVPARDRYIAPSYYDAAAELVEDLRRHVVPGSHWVPRTEPDRLAELVDRFVGEQTASPGTPA